MYNEIFEKMWEYLTANATSLSSLKSADWAFVFGRANPIVAEKAAALYHSGLVKRILVTGGIGKDSGYLKDLDLPEAAYLAARLRWLHKIPDEAIFVEDKATSGGENSRLGMEMIMGSYFKHEKIILLAHATSLRRLHAAHLVEAKKMNFEASYQLVATDYKFDPDNPIDQKEAVGEILRLADWPAKNWAVAQEDLPDDLVAFAREFQAANK